MKIRKKFEEAKLGPYSLKLENCIPNPKIKSIESIIILLIICRIFREG
ncbi:MAG: hypothetical protein ACFFDK_19145 [Promethearchaeota archaeon]